MGDLVEALGLVAAALALVGAGLAVPAALAVRELAARPAPPGASVLAASVLKPLHGTPPGLSANLASTLAQDHAAPFEVLFIVRDPADPAAAIAEAAMAAHPGVPARLVRDPAAARLEPQGFAAPELDGWRGIRCWWWPMPTCAWRPIGCPARRRRWQTRRGPRDLPVPGRSRRTGGSGPARGVGTDWQFLPNAALGEAMGRRRAATAPPWRCGRRCWTGSAASPPFPTCWRTTTRLGEAVRRLGLRVAVAPAVPVHMAHQAGPRDLLAHELRWARTLRSLAPAGYLGMGVTHPLAWGLLASALAPSGWGAAALTAALLGRFGLAAGVDRATGATGGLRRLALLPLRDLLSFAIWAAGLARSSVVWGGRRYRLRRDGSMVELRPGE
jgi:ceramide glucosyltransferase